MARAFVSPGYGARRRSDVLVGKWRITAMFVDGKSFDASLVQNYHLVIDADTIRINIGNTVEHYQIIEQHDRHLRVKSAQEGKADQFYDVDLLGPDTILVHEDKIELRLERE